MPLVAVWKNPAFHITVAGKLDYNWIAGLNWRGDHDGAFDERTKRQRRIDFGRRISVTDAQFPSPSIPPLSSPRSCCSSLIQGFGWANQVTPFPTDGPDLSGAAATCGAQGENDGTIICRDSTGKGESQWACLPSVCTVRYLLCRATGWWREAYGMFLIQAGSDRSNARYNAVQF